MAGWCGPPICNILEVLSCPPWWLCHFISLPLSTSHSNSSTSVLTHYFWVFFFLIVTPAVCVCPYTLVFTTVMQWRLAFFCSFIGHLCVLLGELSVQILCLFVWGLLSHCETLSPPPTALSKHPPGSPMTLQSPSWAAHTRDPDTLRKLISGETPLITGYGWGWVWELSLRILRRWLSACLSHYRYSIYFQYFRHHAPNNSMVLGAVTCCTWCFCQRWTGYIPVVPSDCISHDLAV